MLRFRSTRARLTALSVTLLAAAALVADVGLYSAAAISTANASDAALKAQADLIASGLKLGDSFHGGDLPTQAADGLATDVAIIGPNGIITGTPNHPMRAETLEALAGPVLRTGRPIWVNISDSKGIERRVYSRLVTTVQPSVALVVERSVQAQNGSLWLARLVLGALSIVFVSLGGLLSYWQAGRVLRPVQHITRLARSLGDRDLHRRVELAVPDDELGELVKTFNGMLGRLESSFDAMGTFIADASHELRGPLTHMRSEIELAQSRPRSNGDLMSTLAVVAAEVDHLSDLVDKLLILARADAGVLRPTRTSLDVADFTHEIAARWISVAKGRGVRLHVGAPATGVVLADPTLTRRVLDNLLENAIRHSPSRCTVSLTATRDAEGWIFEVSDQGPGVPPAFKSRIFDRFTRADTSRARSEMGGSGLGLAVSSTLASVQNADLRLVDGAKGATFQLRFPDGVLSNGTSTPGTTV